MKKRLAATFLAVCLITGFFPRVALPDGAKAAAQEPTLQAFSISYTDANGDTQIASLLGSSLSELTLPAGAAYSFDAKFSGGETPASVYISSTTDAGKVYLDATYSEETGSYVTSGYFNDSSVYLPENISVEFFPKAKEAVASHNFSLKDFLLDELKASDLAIEVSEDGETVNASVVISKLIGSQSESVLNVAIDTYTPAVSDASDALDSWLGYSSDLEDLLCYVVPGKDNEQYFLYLDYSDPSTYAMIVHDVSGNRYTKALLTGLVKGKPVSLSTFSEKLADINTISGAIYDYTSITTDMNKLRESVRLNASLTPAEAEEAYRKIDQLEQDKQMFSLVSTALPMIITAAGVAGGPPGLLFSALLSSITSTSSYFWEKRIGAITAAESTFTWATSGTCGKENPYDVVWELRNGVLTFTGKGEIARSLYCPFDNTAVRKIVVNSGITSISLPTPNYTPLLNLTQVVLPSTLTSIDTSCFAGATSLKKIDLPDSLQSIHARAFYGCTALESITIPANVTALGSQAFKDCTALETIYFNPGCNPTIVAEGVAGVRSPFYGASNLKQVIFEGDCPSNLISVSAGTNLPHLGTLLYSSGRPTVYYPADNQTWTDVAALWQQNWSPSHKIDCVLVALGGPSGFCGDELTWEMDLDGNLTISGTGDMYDYYSSDDPHWVYVENFCCVTLDEGVTSIGREAFKNCVNLRTVDIAETVQHIGREAFNNCSSLPWIWIPSFVAGDLSCATFTGCSSLQAIHVDEANMAYCSDDGVLYDQINLELSCCPQGKRGPVRVLSGVESISFNAFKDCTQITQVCIPSTVTLIDSNAFYGCTALTDIYYEGSEDMWNAIDNRDSTLTGGNLLNIHYFSYPHFAVIELFADSEAGGTVSGGGICLTGKTVQVTAAPNPGYRFAGWAAEDGSIISTNASYSLLVWESCVLSALFVPQPSFMEDPVVLADDYALTHTVEVTQTGSQVTVQVTDTGGDPIAETLHVWVAEYTADGQMVDMKLFEKSGTVYTGTVTERNTTLFVLDQNFNPIIQALESRIIT